MEDNMKVIFTVGLPASGKSTWAKKYCSSNKDWIRVCRDDLRHMRGHYWIPEQEDLITLWERYCIVSALEAGKNVVVDATNLNEEYLKALKTYITESVGEVKFQTQSFLAVGLDTLIQRDFERPGGVGEKVIKKFWNRYMKNTQQELKYVPDENLPKAVIVDIDGTLAEKGDRSPFDWFAVGEDAPYQDIFQLVRFYQREGYKILILSGRDAVCRPQTEKWLQEHNLDYDELHMREEGSFEKDSKVKERFLLEVLAPKYNVELVIDDRNQVVEMWRSLGLRCLQVAEGDF